jgi:hypothetical protein
MSPVIDRECPQCHGKNLVDGGVRSRRNPYFVPRGKFMWLGYPVSASVCLDCGYLGHRLEPHHLEELKRKMSEG